MKIIEALKKVKANRKKIDDLQAKIPAIFAHMETDKKPNGYDNPKKTLKEWVQSIHDLQKDNAELLAKVQMTNLKTNVTIEFEEGKPITKTIHEWLYRRREGVDHDYATMSRMSSRLKPETTQNTDGTLQVVNVVYNYPVETRDKKISALSEEKVTIDSALEITNATTDLLEV